MDKKIETEVAEMKALNERVSAAEKKVQDLEAEKANLIAKGSYNKPSSSVNSDEKKALRYFNCNHPKQLLEVNVNHPDFKGVPEELKHLVKNFKQSFDTARWVSQIFHGEPQDRVVKDRDGSEKIAPSNVKGMLDHYYGKNVLAPKIKAFGSTVVGGGDEWVPTGLASSYVEEYELEFVLERGMRTVPQPTNPFELPVMTGVTKARRATENTAMTANNFSTTKLVLSAVKSSEYYELPEELNEDSAPDFLSAGRDEVVKAQFRAIEAATINGKTGTHIDSDTQLLGADVAEKFWTGFRGLAIANSANGSTVDFGGAFTTALLRTMRARLGKFGSNPNELLWIVGPSIYTQFLTLDEVMTLDKVGPQATVLKGILALYQGIGIINSQYMREDLNATGVYDGVTTTFGGILLVNKTRFYYGQRRPIQVKMMADLPAQDRMLLASYQRKSFVGHTQSASEVSVVYGYEVPK
jgi:hypothetical protein